MYHNSPDFPESLLNLILFIIFFIAGIFFTRWVFKINRIVSLLESQNAYSVIQIRLLKRPLLNAGMTDEELNRIIEKGNIAEDY